MNVRGHQDSATKTKLSWLAKLNIRADAIATTARYECTPLTNTQMCAWHPSSSIKIFINKFPIHK